MRKFAELWRDPEKVQPLAAQIGESEFFVDPLFYQHSLRRCIVIELKVGEFKPEYVSR